MSEKVICPACMCKDAEHSDETGGYAFYDCPVCGRFELDADLIDCNIDRNHLASYLIYHAYHHSATGGTEYRYHTIMDKDSCDRYRHEFDGGHNLCGRPVHMDTDMIDAWYPKTFAERVDKILLYIAEHTEHIGQTLTVTIDQLLSLLFIDRQKLDKGPFSAYKDQWIQRNPDDFIHELNFMLNYLKDQQLVDCSINNQIVPNDLLSASKYSCNLTPVGYARVDELQKNSSHGRSVLVAMSFHDTEKLREAIRKGIQDAGYVAIFIDEVQHNDFITPELLKHIRDSKFVVVDLTHQNNGAYFEEGYAMGLGKPVIQLCKHGETLHFDIAQKNTILWDTEDDIPERLCNRIKATIE